MVSLNHSGVLRAALGGFVSSQSARETKAASHVLQAIWTYKELRSALNKAGWTKSHFKVRSPHVRMRIDVR